MMGILTDVTKCIGCNQCVAACKATYDLPPDVPRRWDKPDGLSARNWTSVLRRPGGRFVRKQCRHCLEPACVSVCPVGALRKTPEGPVIYRNDICIGCRYCLMACPYGIPRYDWDQPKPYVRKCKLCYERIKEGKQPACTAACPTEATIFGERDELLRRAERRVRESPGRYIPKIFGRTEIGGTSVLYLSDVDLSFLSYRTNPGEKPLPMRTELAMTAVPFVFVGVGGAMAGLKWIIDRRIKLQQEQLAQQRQAAGEESHDG
jgi:formate dehydrogenase iron-sulfur subunit